MPRYALVIGIAQYKSKHLSNLSKPVGDSTAVAALLQKFGQCSQSPVLLQGLVTTRELVRTLKGFFASASD